MSEREPPTVPSVICDTIGMAYFKIALALGSRVHIDGDTSITGTVTGALWETSGRHELNVSWMHAGTSQSAWFAPHRITVAN